MRYPHSTALFAMLAAVSSLTASDPAKIDPSARSEAFSSAPLVTPTVVEKSKATQATVSAPSLAPEANQRAHVNATRVIPSEADVKTVVTPTTKRPSDNVHERVMYSSPGVILQPGVGTTESPKMSHFQTRIDDAGAAAARRAQPELSKTTGFGQIGRFVFRRNKSEPTAQSPLPVASTSQP